jgi:ATP phosphoribosyltransferase
MADAIVDITSTGTTLRMNRLAEVEEVLASSVRLFANPDRVEDGKVQQLRTALGSVLAAEGKRYLMMNVPSDRLPEVESVIPGMGGPTVMEVDSGVDAADDRGAVAVHAVVNEREVFETITRLKEAGASDILVTEIERLVE